VFGLARVYFNPQAQADEMIAVTDQMNCRIAVFNPAYTDWDNQQALAWAFYPKNDAFELCSDAKLRRHPDGGLVVLMTASGGYAAVVRYPDGEILWQTVNTANNPHASELLPNGCFAVASSTGGEVRVFNTRSDDQKYASVPLEHAHGVLWDPERNLLWMLGLDRLIACAVTLRDGLPELTVLPEYSASLPSPCGHDLSPVYGDHNRLWITAHAVYQFDKKARALLTEYDGVKFINGPSVKSAGNMPISNTLVRTVPNGTMRSWNTNEVQCCRADGERFVCRSASGAYYKARVFCADYQ
jgi:WD40 repeat protein